jgi:hypothetical protein
MNRELEHRNRKAQPLLLLAAALFLPGLASFAIAIIASARISESGDARLESLATGLSSLGGALIAAAVAIAAVQFTLRLRGQSEQKRRWAEFQVSLLDEAYRWIIDVSNNFGELLQKIQAWTSAPESEQDAKHWAAIERAQRFYDHEQTLGEVVRFTHLIENNTVKGGLKRADDILRQWNEATTGRHETRAVYLPGTMDEWDVYHILSEARDEIREAHAVAVKQAYE